MLLLLLSMPLMPLFFRLINTHGIGSRHATMPYDTLMLMHMLRAAIADAMLDAIAMMLPLRRCRDDTYAAFHAAALCHDDITYVYALYGVAHYC